MATLDSIFEDRDLSDHMEVPVLLNTDAADRVAVAERTVNAATEAHLRMQEYEAERMQKTRTDEAAATLEQAKAELDAARQAALDHLYVFRFTSIGAQAWEDLILRHPPTDEHRQEHGRVDFNPDTFPTAAVAACLAAVVHPDGTVDELGTDVRQPDGTLDLDALDTAEQSVRRTIKAKVKQGVWQQIWGATWRANVGASQVPPSLLGSSATRASGGESEQP